MRKSELLAIKAREYERGVADTHKKFRITPKDVEGWAAEAWDRANGFGEFWDGKEHIEDCMKEMLIEIGVEIVSLQEVDKNEQ